MQVQHMRKLEVERRHMGHLDSMAENPIYSGHPNNLEEDLQDRQEEARRDNRQGDNREGHNQAEDRPDSREEDHRDNREGHTQVEDRPDIREEDQNNPKEKHKVDLEQEHR
jgi:hypothetical protein